MPASNTNTSIRYPLFVFYDGDLDLVSDIDLLQRKIEPWDVHLCEVFDASGAAIGIHAEGVIRTKYTVGGGTVIIDGLHSSEETVARLHSLLKEFEVSTQATKRPINDLDPEAATLQALVERTTEFFEPKS